MLFGTKEHCKLPKYNTCRISCFLFCSTVTSGFLVFTRCLGEKKAWLDGVDAGGKSGFKRTLLR